MNFSSFIKCSTLFSVFDFKCFLYNFVCVYVLLTKTTKYKKNYDRKTADLNYFITFKAIFLLISSNRRLLMFSFSFELNFFL